MKRFSLILLYIFSLLLLVEVSFGYLGNWIVQGEAYSYDRLKQERRDIISDSQERVAANLDQGKKGKKRKYRVEILHPYLGYVIDYHDDECPDIGFCDERMRSYKDLLQGKDFLEASPERAIVAIIGGSFAYGIANNSADGKLLQALSSFPQFDGKEIIIYTLATGGYKQPQQLFAIQYYLSMGAHFDMIINIDGFNDIVLPQAENIPFNTNPFFPRMWHQRIARGSENRLSKSFQGLLAYLQEQRSNTAEQMNKSLLRHSPTWNLVWYLKDRSIQQHISRTESEYLKKARNVPRVKSRMAIAGTKFQVEDTDLALKHIAAFWRRSSEILYATAQAAGIEYYHFLQPNQYVKDSKAMSQAERAVALLEGNTLIPPYKEGATLGYPYLIAEGKKLKASDVPFQDLTMIFKDNDEMLYRDACCHLTGKGYGYVIDEIVRSIISKELISD